MDREGFHTLRTIEISAIILSAPPTCADKKKLLNVRPRKLITPIMMRRMIKSAICEVHPRINLEERTRVIGPLNMQMKTMIATTSASDSTCNS